MKALWKKIKLLFSYLAGHSRQVVAAVMEKDGKILIAKRKRGGTLAGQWEFPGGKLEPGETPEECLRRELKEEFDIDAEIGGFLASSKFIYFCVPIELVAYRARHVSGEFKVNDHEEIEWVARNELSKYRFTLPDRPIVKLLQSSHDTTT